MTTIALNTDGPREPGYVLELAEGLAEITRVLNHLTRDPAALTEPAEVDALVRYVATAAGRLPQLLEQVCARLAIMQAGGEVRAVGGEYAGRPELAVGVAEVSFRVAGTMAGGLTEALDGVTSVTSTLAATGTGEEDGDDG